MGPRALSRVAMPESKRDTVLIVQRDRTEGGCELLQDVFEKEARKQV